MDERATIPLDAETKRRSGRTTTTTSCGCAPLTCTTLIEGEVRRRLRQDFDVTLPRFDPMAQLDKTPTA